MKTRILKGACLLTAGALLTSASVGTARAQLPFVPSLPFHHSNAAEKLVTAAVIATAIYFIAKHQATERQREVAEMRARQSYARMSSQRKANMEKKEGPVYRRGDGAGPGEFAEGKKNCDDLRHSNAKGGEQ